MGRMSSRECGGALAPGVETQAQAMTTVPLLPTMSQFVADRP